MQFYYMYVCNLRSAHVRGLGLDFFSLLVLLFPEAVLSDLCTGLVPLPLAAPGVPPDVPCVELLGPLDESLVSFLRRDTV